MLIDWFTVGAQALNFIILVALMKHFLYKPVLDAIDAREKRIADELADADRKKADASKDGDDFRRKSADFDKQRADLLGKATADARSQCDALLAAAHAAADDIAAQRKQALIGDARRLDKALIQRTQAEVFAVARRTLADLANVRLETSAVEVFMSRLSTLDDTTRAKLAKALAAPNGAVLIRSAFDLPTAQRVSLQKAIDDGFAVTIAPRYETAPELVGGIELSADGQKFAWSISDYLVSLSHGVDRLIEDEAPMSAAAPASMPPGPASAAPLAARPAIAAEAP